MDIDLNADLGEGFGPWRMGEDEALLDIVSSANVACGFHAGDPVIMDRTVRMARARGVEVGAHVGFPDLLGFGRRPMQIEPKELVAYVLYQLSALDGMARTAGHRMTHMSFHGALGNMAAADAALAAGACGGGFRSDAHRQLLRQPRHRGCGRALRPARAYHLPGRPRLRRRRPAGAAQAARFGDP
jgi:lactam utilization protein B